MPYTRVADLWTDSVAPSSGTRAVPSASTEGMDLTGIASFRVIVSADSTKTLDGTGNVQFWLYDGTLARWVRSPQLDYAVTPTGVTWANVRDIVSADFEVGVLGDRVVAATSSVGVSSGGITVQIQAYKA